MVNPAAFRAARRGRSVSGWNGAAGGDALVEDGIERRALADALLAHEHDGHLGLALGGHLGEYLVEGGLGLVGVVLQARPVLGPGGLRLGLRLLHHGLELGGRRGHGLGHGGALLLLLLLFLLLILLLLVGDLLVLLRCGGRGGRARSVGI